MTDHTNGTEGRQGKGQAFARMVTAQAFGRAYNLGLAAREPASGTGTAVENPSAAARIEKRRLNAVRKTTERLKALRLSAAPTPLNDQ